MEVRYERCCGLDIHKRMVVACLVMPGQGREPQREATKAKLTSDDHFTVDGTLRQAWASLKSVQPRDNDQPPPTAAKNAYATRPCGSFSTLTPFDSTSSLPVAGFIGGGYGGYSLWDNPLMETTRLSLGGSGTPLDIRVRLAALAAITAILGATIACGRSDPQQPSPTASPALSATTEPSVPPATPSPSASPTNGHTPFTTVPAERPVAIDEQALATDPLLVYSSERADGGVDFYTYSRIKRTVVSAFGVPLDVRAGTPQLRGRTLVVPINRSVAILNLQGRVIEVTANLTAEETVVGLAVSRDETMLAIGILSQVTTDSRLVVVELSSNREVLRVSQEEFAALTTLGAPAPTSWFAGDSGVELRAEVGQGATAIPGVSAYLTGHLTVRKGGPRRISEDGQLALSRAGGAIGACDGPSLAFPALRLENPRDDTLIVELSQPNMVVSASFVAPRGPGVLYSTSPLRGDCWDNLASATWHLWDGITDSPVSDPEAVLRNWYGSRLVELECEGTRSAWQFVRNSADMRCPDGGPAELWLDAARVDRVTVAGIVGFAD